MIRGGLCCGKEGELQGWRSRRSGNGKMGTKVWKECAQILAVLISTTEGTRIEQHFLKERFIHEVRRGLSVWLRLSSLFVVSL